MGNAGKLQIILQLFFSAKSWCAIGQELRMLNSLELGVASPGSRQHSPQIQNPVWREETGKGMVTTSAGDNVTVYAWASPWDYGTAKQ